MLCGFGLTLPRTFDLRSIRLNEAALAGCTLQAHVPTFYNMRVLHVVGNDASEPC